MGSEHLALLCYTRSLTKSRQNQLVWSAANERVSYYPTSSENYIYLLKNNKFMVKLSELKQCPECGSSNVKYSKEKDRVYCNDCGEIFAKLTQEQEKKLEIFP